MPKKLVNPLAIPDLFRETLMCVCFDIATPRVVLFLTIFNVCSLVSYAVLWLLLKFKSLFFKKLKFTFPPSIQKIKN